MPDESAHQKPGEASSSPLQPREQILAAIILLLGPDTDYARRVRAMQRLTRAGADILPLLLQTLHMHPEITTPAWPWWPPQYEQIGRLLIQLSEKAHLSLTDLLRASSLPQPPGPVLWISMIEAMGQLPHMEYEPLLREGLEAPWWTVRYAATTAIANRAIHISLCPATREALYQIQQSDPEMPVRLVASCALLRCADSSGLVALSAVLETSTTREIRRSTLFILASELPIPTPPAQKERLAELLLRALSDDDPQCALHAARAMHSVASISTLPGLDRLLTDEQHPQTQLAALAALEELASRKTMRYAIQQQQLPRHIAPLLQRPEPELRRQACSTLATLGGEYATAILGTVLLDSLHPANLDAIEALRLLPDIERPAILARVLRWLEHALTRPIDSIQVRALDALSSLIWQAHVHHRHTLLHTIFQELQQSGCLFQLLASSSAWTRQRTIELLGLLDPQLAVLRPTLLEMLHHDIDSNVRTCLARIFGQNTAFWALPDLLLTLLDSNETVAEAALNALQAIPLPGDPLIHYAIQEIAAYHLPLAQLHERRHLARLARAWLKRQTTPYSSKEMAQ